MSNPFRDLFNLKDAPAVPSTPTPVPEPDRTPIDGVFGHNCGRPKTKAWFSVYLDHHQYMPLEQLPYKDGLRLSEDMRAGMLQSVPHGFGGWSFWSYPAQEEL